MALINYLYSHYGLICRPGKKHQCPVCHHSRKSFSMKKDGKLAKCFKCGNYFVETSSGIYDSTYRPAA